MPVTDVRPTRVTNPDTSIPSGLTQWDSVDLGNGAASVTVAPLLNCAMSWGFDATTDPIISAVANFQYQSDNTASMLVYVSYNSGSVWELLGTIDVTDTELAQQSLTLDESRIDDAGDVLIGFKVFDVGSIVNFSLQLMQTAAVDFKIVNTLAQEIIEEMGGRTTDGKMIRIVERWIDDVYKKIMAFHNWSWARETSDIDTVAGEDTYTILTASMHISGFRKSSGEKIVYRSREQLTNLGWDFTQTGTPLFWYSEGMNRGAMNVVLTPIPTTAETLTAYGTPRPVNLLTDDYIPLPTEFMPVLKDGVRAYYSRNDGHPEDGAMYDQLFGNGLMILRSRFASEPDDYSRMSDSDIPNAINTTMGRWPSNFPQ